MKVTNTGGTALDIEVAGAAAAGGFDWRPLATRLEPREVASISVTPRATGAAAGTLVIQAFASPGGTAVAGFPFTVVPPAPKRRIATRRVFVDPRLDWSTVFSVQDGDLLRVRDVTGRVTLGGFSAASATPGRKAAPPSQRRTAFPRRAPRATR